MKAALMAKIPGFDAHSPHLTASHNPVTRRDAAVSLYTQGYLQEPQPHWACLAPVTGSCRPPHPRLPREPATQSQMPVGYLAGQGLHHT